MSEQDKRRLEDALAVAEFIRLVETEDALTIEDSPSVDAALQEYEMRLA